MVRNVADIVWRWLIWVKTPYFEALYLSEKCNNKHDSKCPMLEINTFTSCSNFELWEKYLKILFLYRKDYNGISQSCFVQVLCKFGDLWHFILSWHPWKEFKSIQPLFLNTGAQLLFVARSTLQKTNICSNSLVKFFETLDPW